MTGGWFCVMSRSSRRNHQIKDRASAKSIVSEMLTMYERMGFVTSDLYLNQECIRVGVVQFW